ncbi:MAG: hypothetical protein FJ399_21620, partial [Verrucomicrobia bacterium]|nr:hypothetical protein [Verrucomicrobiota bacterium]
MSPVTVIADREMSAQTIALNEQRAAPNLKNVVAFDEYPNSGDSNIAEFMKFIPGLAVMYSGISGDTASIRGLPGGSTSLSIDGIGMPGSSLGPSRNASLWTVPTDSISRIEVTKVPTPDMPAEGLGGSVNVISRGGFERKKPLFTYNLFSSFRGNDPVTLSERTGPTRKLTTRHILPSAETSYFLPVQDTLAINVAAAYYQNYYESHATLPTWDLVQLLQTSSAWQDTPSLVMTRSGRVGIAWKIGPDDVLGASIQYRKREGTSAQHNLVATYGAGATGGPTFTQGSSAGNGSMTQTIGSWLELHNAVAMTTLKYSHKGRIWRVDANAGHSVAKHQRPSTEKGYFSTVTATLTNLVIRGDGTAGTGNNKESVVPTSLRVTDRANTPVDPFNGNQYSITTAAKNAPSVKDAKTEARLDLGRDFLAARPFSLKTGLAATRSDMTARNDSLSYTFRPGQSVDVRKAGNYDLVHAAYSAQAPAILGGQRVQWVNALKAYGLYQANPSYFVIDEAAAYRTRVNGARELEEAIYAGYLRGDLKLARNRLWLVGGIRYERTEDEGRGPLNDITAQYVKDASGRIVRNAAGQPTLITTDQAARDRLTYK